MSGAPEHPRPRQRSAAAPGPSLLWRDLLIAAGLSVGPLVGVGLARFAYALLLPPMRADLGWSYTEAGAMNAANAVGYLLGAVLAAPLMRRVGMGRVFFAGLVVTAASLLTCAATRQLAVLLGLRLIAGVAGAVAFVAAASMAAQVGARRPPGQAALLVGTCISGAAIGILVSGLAIPPALGALDPHLGWRIGWLLLGVVAVLTIGPALLAARRIPPPRGPAPGVDISWPRRRLIATALSYALFGIGYIAYMTFIVAFLESEGLTMTQITLFWTVLGAAAVAAGFAWGPLLGRARAGRGLALVLAPLAVGAALPLVARGPIAAFGSAVLFGATFLSVVTAVTLIVRRTLPVHQWNGAIGWLTAAFAIGQCVGPLLAGILSDRADGVRAGLLLSAGLLGLAALVAMTQRATDDAAQRRDPDR